MSNIDDSLLKEVIVGRVDPYIYSFETNTLPNLLKVGDTYRPVEERLAEWRKYYANLQEVSRHSAIVEEEVYFRDHAIHSYLKDNGFENMPFDKSNNIFSKEFFKDAKKIHVENAIQDVQNNYKKSPKYDYYDGLRNITEFHHERAIEYAPRPNQQEVIDKFIAARKSGRTNLLMYAVMRFGKSITSIWCAKEMNAKITVIVSAKADVREEWKKTVESDKALTGFRFMDATALKRTPKISEVFGKKFELGNGKKEVCTNIVLFFTLQDLAGSTQEIKSHHEFLYENKIDLLIIDETHFGARAPLLGKILAGEEVTDEDKKSFDQAEGEEDKEYFGNIKKLKSIDAGIKLHLSGTPYRILMGSEFEPDDIIAFVQFADIYRAKVAWNEENLGKEDAEEEWKNPYFGFPQMIRFAFNPNATSRKLLEDIDGTNPAELFVPQSTKKDTKGTYRLFSHETEVLELLQVLDGTKQDVNMLGLLDHEPIKNGKLARHIVFALQYRASCDALETLIKKHAGEFKNLSGYKIINAAGLDMLSTHDTPEKVKNVIKAAEENGEETITLTVNKMLTGVTIPQWDTMIYLKATMSPQDYDQAIFRLQSPWTKKYHDEKGHEIVRDMKPQTLLVDLYPTRMFQMQEQKAVVYGININKTGNNSVAESIKRELEISPIIRINAELGKLEEVTPANIMDIVRQYESTRAIADDVRDIAVDVSLMSHEELAAIISSYPELGSKAGILRINPNEGDGDDMDGGGEAGAGTPDEDEPTGNSTGTGTEPSTDATKVDVDVKKFENKLRTIYLLVLLFAFLSSTEEKSFEDVIENLNANTDNIRIAQNLSLDKNELELLRKLTNGNIERALDYKIHNADVRANDDTTPPSERIDNAIHKFGKISDSEIFTPKAIVDKIYNEFDEDFWQNTENSKILDIASKSGSFANGYVRQVTARGLDLAQCANNFYSVPTSGAAYEFTRKTYETLGLNLDNIAQHITAYDLIGMSSDEVKWLLSQDKKFSDITLDDLKRYNERQDESEGKVKFTAVVGNPPYQVSDNDSGKGSARPLYHLFIENSINLNPRFVSLITPSVWFTGGKGLSNFRKAMLNDVHFRKFDVFTTPKDVFPTANLRGGVNYFLWDSEYDNSTENIRVVQHQNNEIIDDQIRPFQIAGVQDIFISDNRAVGLLEKMYSNQFIKTDIDDSAMLASHISSRNPFGITTKFRNTPNFHNSKNDVKRPIKLYVKNNITGYIEKSLIQNNKPWINKWKVITPFANNISTDLNDDNLNALAAEPNSIVTETYLVIGADLELDAVSSENLIKYLKTRFVRALVALAKANQNGTRQTYRFVPYQDFTQTSDINWTKSIIDIDKQLYTKYDLDQTEIEFIESKVKAME